MTTGFEEFAAEVGPRLRRALVPVRGTSGAADAAAEALAYAWEYWDRVRLMDNPVGYLYRVGQSRTRPRKVPVLPRPDPLLLPEVDPDLVPALLELPATQRTAVWLVHACGWPYGEVAEAMEVSVSAVGTHVTRALQRLRTRLEATSDA